MTKAEAPIARECKSGRYEVAADNDETKRSTSLIEAVSARLVEKGGHKLLPSRAATGALPMPRSSSAMRRPTSARRRLPPVPCRATHRRCNRVLSGAARVRR